MTDDRIMIYTGVGIKDTLKLEDSVINSLDNVLKIRLDRLSVPLFAIGALMLAYLIWKNNKEKLPGYKNKRTIYTLYGIGLIFLIVVCYFHESVSFALKFTNVPILPLVFNGSFWYYGQFYIEYKIGTRF